MIKENVLSLEFEPESLAIAALSEDRRYATIQHWSPGTGKEPDRALGSSEARLFSSFGESSLKQVMGVENRSWTAPSKAIRLSAFNAKDSLMARFNHQQLLRPLATPITKLLTWETQVT